MPAAPLQFWYEFASTYSYVAAFRIEQLASKAGVEVAWRPFLLGPIFAEQGWNDSPFNLYPVKGRYMWRDLERICQREGLPFRKPSTFPRSSLLATRVAMIASPEGWCPELSRAVFRANFAEDRDISQWETVAEIVKAVGRDPDQVYEKALSPDNKEAVKRQTETCPRRPGACHRSPPPSPAPAHTR